MPPPPLPLRSLLPTVLTLITILDIIKWFSLGAFTICTEKVGMVQDFPGVVFCLSGVSCALSKGRKRGRGETGRMGVYKWYRNFPVVLVGMRKGEYV